jgi:hypothetical protein
MALKRIPFRDPRTVARDIPGVLDTLFSRLTGGLVASLNRRMFSFADVIPVPEELVEKSQLQKAMLFELSMVRAEIILDGKGEPSWEDCLIVAGARQKLHYDAQIPVKLERCDIDIASHAAQNLLVMLASVQNQYPNMQLQRSPIVPGLGWIASGDLPLNFHPKAIRASAGFRPCCAGGATCDRRSWSGLRRRSRVAERLAA